MLLVRIFYSFLMGHMGIIRWKCERKGRSINYAIKIEFFWEYIERKIVNLIFVECREERINTDFIKRVLRMKII